MNKWGFIGSAYAPDSPNVAAQRCVNLYPETVDVGGEKNVVSLRTIPGLSVFTTLADTPVRALFSMDGLVVAVAGTSVYTLSTLGESVLIGTVASNTSQASVHYNGDGGLQLFVVSGGKRYIYDTETTAFAIVQFVGGTTDVPVTFGAYLNGFFFALDTDTSTVYASKEYDGTSWTASHYTQRSLAADQWLSMFVNPPDVWLFGSLTTEAWRFTGASPFPLEPIGGAAIQTGILAPHSVCAFANGIAWLGTKAGGARQVYLAMGYQEPMVISTNALDQAIGSYTSVSDAVAYLEQHDGHEFYVITFPIAGHTWAFDASTKQWHERGWWNQPAMQYDAYRPGTHCAAFGKHLLGDRLSGTIWQHTDTVHLDADGVPLRWLRQCPHIADQGRKMRHGPFTLDAETGVNTSALVGREPQLMLDWSDDSGHTFNHERWVSMGATSAFRTRCVWNRLGSSRDRIYRLSGADPVRIRLVDANLEVA
mgnify:CR=1 FL=1